MHKIKLNIYCSLILFCSMPLFIPQTVYAQDQVIKWLRAGSLHNWYSSLGNEKEVGRTFNDAEQIDGLSWEAQFEFQDTKVGSGIWIGTTNYSDRTLNTTVPYKVIGLGPGSTVSGMFFTKEFKMIGRFKAPTVIVDGEIATDNALNDKVDSVSEDLKPDRMIYNVVNSNIGITMTRKLMEFSQQNHEQYFIYDYVFENTGIYNEAGDREEKTLTGVYFFWTFRRGFGWEAFKKGWTTVNNFTWGRNTVTDQIGIDPNVPGFNMRAQFSWFGRHSAFGANSLGFPYSNGDGRLTAAQFNGYVVLHADKSAGDKSDDLYQPVTTAIYKSDGDPKQIDQYNPSQMALQYAMMLRGHTVPSQAEQVGDKFADQYGSDAGGYGSTMGFGPYDLKPGDKIHIVWAEGVAGLSRDKCFEIGKKWLDGQTHSDVIYTMPDGSTSNNPNTWKDAWVMTGKDSIKKVFGNAMFNYQADYNIPKAPPPPSTFEIKSGGDRITLEWSNNAESWPNFQGYKIYRAISRPDTFYTKIFECDRSNLINSFDDTSATRGRDYFYYIESYDDGSTNDVSPGVPLVSNKFYTMTNKAARLRRPAKNVLSEIRVVPNPFDIRAREIQFGSTGAEADRITFYGLPPECVIRIFTERGDLVETLNHTDGSGDEVWNSLTSSDQLVVSGLYIAYFEVSRDIIDEDTGAVILKKGDSAFRKFIIIR